MLKKYFNVFKKGVISANRNAGNHEVTYDTKRTIIDQYRIMFSCKNFVETGTFLGDTTWFFRNMFDRLYSIELSHDLAVRAKKRFQDCTNVEIVEGNSGVVLKDLIARLAPPVLYWLDGHYSSEFFHQGEYFITAKGDKHTPIQQELDVILNSGKPSVILIDDARLFNGENDYPTLASLERKIAGLCSEYKFFVKSDVIHVITGTLVTK
jgi:hypothetical protein